VAVSKPRIGKYERVVALDVIARSLKSALDRDIVSWEDYPEVGQYSWERIVEYAEYNSGYHAPTADDLAEAIKVLGARAAKEAS
jgi:hypothetical protein